MVAFVTEIPSLVRSERNLDPLMWGMICSYFGLLLLFRTLRYQKDKKSRLDNRLDRMGYGGAGEHDEDGEEQSAARTESEKMCATTPTALSEPPLRFPKMALFLRNSVLAELSVYGH